jgi:hypothetical protein
VLFGLSGLLRPGAMLFGMGLAGLAAMMGRMSRMAMSDLRMMRRLFVIAALMRFGSFLMVLRRGLVMRCGRSVMFGGLRLGRHLYLLMFWLVRQIFRLLARAATGHTSVTDSRRAVVNPLAPGVLGPQSVSSESSDLQPDTS